MCLDMMGLDEDVSFERFVERHQSTLQHYATGMVGDKKQARDLVKKTLCELFDHLDQLRDKDLLTVSLTVLRRRCKEAGGRDLAPSRTGA